MTVQISILYLKKYNLKSGLNYSSLIIEIFDFNDEIAEINIGGYLVPRLYVIVIIVDETIYKFPSELFKELFIKLQRENAFI